MKFNKFKWLRDEAWKRLGDAQPTCTQGWSVEDALRADVLTLAYIGDAVYSLYVRQRVIGTGIAQVQVLHTIVTACINAKAQAEALQSLMELLTDDEVKLVKRARNAHVHVPRSATVQEYRWSTAFEALIGYLAVTQQEERMNMVMETAFRSIVAHHQSDKQSQ